MSQALARRCSECSASLATGNSKSKTCSDSCRSKRSRRLSKVRNKGGRPFAPEHIQEVRDALDTKTGDIANQVIKEEMQPIVREALTDEVLNSLNRLVGISSKAITALESDLTSADDRIRQRAYEMVLKYTIGNEAVAPKDVEAEGGLTVNFNLPRASSVAVEQGDVPQTAEVVKICNICTTEKPEDQFVDGSDRCETCHAGFQSQVEHLLNADR